MPIVHTNALTSLTGLKNITSIGGYLGISHNSTLTSLSGLEGLNSVGNDLVITDNYALTSLSGLDNIEAGSIEDLTIEDNTDLFHCSVLSICNYLSNPNGTVVILDNITGCDSPEEVQDSCEANGVNIDEQSILNKIELYPNPANQQLHISAEGYSIQEVSIYTLTGQQIMKTRPVNGKVDISHLRSGMYILEVTIENTRLRQKLLVQR